MNGITLLDMHNLDIDDVEIGKVSSLTGRAAVEYVIKATELAMEGQVDAIATAPLNKEAIQLAGYHYIGHTEILAGYNQNSSTVQLCWQHRDCASPMSRAIFLSVRLLRI